MTFIDDLKFGEKYEQECFKYLRNPKKVGGKIKAYDLIDEDGDTYEVKADRLATKTGNICIEFSCSNKPSGISSTTSKAYFYFVVGSPTRLYKIPTDDIRSMIADGLFHKAMNGGDGWRSRFYLFRESLFEKYILV